MIKFKHVLLMMVLNVVFCIPTLGQGKTINETPLLYDLFKKELDRGDTITFCHSVRKLNKDEYDKFSIVFYHLFMANKSTIRLIYFPKPMYRFVYQYGVDDAESYRNVWPERPYSIDLPLNSYIVFNDNVRNPKFYFNGCSGYIEVIANNLHIDMTTIMYYTPDTLVGSFITFFNKYLTNKTSEVIANTPQYNLNVYVQKIFEDGYINKVDFLSTGFRGKFEEGSSFQMSHLFGYYSPGTFIALLHNANDYCPDKTSYLGRINPIISSWYSVKVVDTGIFNYEYGQYVKTPSYSDCVIDYNKKKK